MVEQEQSKIKEFKSQISEFYGFTTTRPVAILMILIGLWFLAGFRMNNYR